MPPRQAWPQARLPASLDSVLLKALDPSPAARYPTAKRFREALQAVHERLERGTRPVLASAGLAAAAAAGVALIFQLGPTGVGRKVADLVFAPTPSDEATAQWSKAAEPSENGGAPSETVLTNLAAEAVDIDTLPLAEDEPVPQEPAEAQPTNPPQQGIAEGDGEQRPQAAATADEDPSAEEMPSEMGSDQAELSDEERVLLEKAERLLERGGSGHVRSLDLFRKLAKAHEYDPRILEGWSRAAAGAKWWGESLRVALRWASFDDSPRAQLHLARTQRLIGQRYGAIQTLERLLERSPKNQQAQAMLDRYRGR
jgi:hypothetical protein